MNRRHIFSNIQWRRRLKGLIINTKFVNISIQSSFFLYYLLTSIEKFPKHRGASTIAESFALNFEISLPLTNKQLFGPLQCKLKQNFFFVTVKLIKYIFSAVSVCSNPCVGPFPRTNVFLLLINMSRKTHVCPKN